MMVYNIVSIFYRQEKKEEYFIVHDDGIYGAQIVSQQTKN